MALGGPSEGPLPGLPQGEEPGPDLWGKTCLVKTWGRIGKRHQRFFHWPQDSQELARLLQKTIRKRNAHNYRIG